MAQRRDPQHHQQGLGAHEKPSMWVRGPDASLALGGPKQECQLGAVVSWAGPWAGSATRLGASFERKSKGLLQVLTPRHAAPKDQSC